MPTQIGLVTRQLPGGLTEVLTERKSACGGCQPSHSCSSCLTSSKIKARVHNPVGARSGDIVEIHLDSRAIYYSALVLYGLPLLGLILGAALGAGNAGTWLANASVAPALFGVLGIAAGFAVAVAIGNSTFARQRLLPTITRVVTPVIPTNGAVPS